MTIISDTGPIIALAKIQHLNLLKSLFEKVYITPIVYKELMSKTGVEEEEEIEKALKEFITIKEIEASPPEVEYTLKEIGGGEKQSIELAYKSKSSAILLIDDKAGRQSAKRLNIPTTGTIGVLIIAKNKGLVENVTGILKLMREKGYWFSDEIIETAKKLTGE